MSAKKHLDEPHFKPLLEKRSRSTLLTTNHIATVSSLPDSTISQPRAPSPEF